MKRPKIILLLVLGVLFVALGIYYWVVAAGDLPTWLPGYEAGSTHVHLKHGLAAVLLGVACFVWAWFASGGKPALETKSEQNKEKE